MDIRAVSYRQYDSWAGTVHAGLFMHETEPVQQQHTKLGAHAERLYACSSESNSEGNSVGKQLGNRLGGQYVTCLKLWQQTGLTL